MHELCEHRLSDMPPGSLLVASLHNFCNNICVDVSGKDLDAVCRCVLASHAHVEDRCHLLKSVCPDLYVDGERLAQLQKQFVRGNALGDSDVWIEFMSYLQFSKPEIPLLNLQQQILCMWSLSRMFDEQSAKHACGWTFSDTCKLFILSCVERIALKYTITRYISKRLGEMNIDLCNRVVEILAEERNSHTTAQYVTTIQTVIGLCHVCPQSNLAIRIAAHKDTLQSQSNAWSLQGYAAIRSRPSMTQVFVR